MQFFVLKILCRTLFPYSKIKIAHYTENDYLLYMESNSSLPLVDHNTLYLRRINPQSITFRGKEIKLKLNPIFRLNYFITCYNFQNNKVNSITLKILPRNKLYYFCYPILQPKYLILHFILDFIPYFNILWVFFLIFMWVVYEKARVVYESNKKLVRNPLRKMIFDPEICFRYKCMNKFLEIRVRGSSLNPETEDRITVMVYNASFKKNFTQFPFYRYLHLFHILVCTVIIVFCYLWIYQALDIRKIAVFGIN